LQEPEYEIVGTVQGKMSTANRDVRFVHTKGGFSLSEGMLDRFKSYPERGIEGVENSEPTRWYFTGILEANAVEGN
jgi:hypothetical protein